MTSPFGTKCFSNLFLQQKASSVEIGGGQACVTDVLLTDYQMATKQFQACLILINVLVVCYPLSYSELLIFNQLNNIDCTF